MIRAIYPGTFDPMTRGHEDLVRRALQIFDFVTVAVADSLRKNTFFNLDERVAMAQAVLGNTYGDRVRVEGFKGLLKSLVREQGAQVVVRGLRAVSDFDYEFQMAGMNRVLMPDVEMVFLMPSDYQRQFISSSVVREIAQLGGELEDFVHPVVARSLRDKAKTWAQVSHVLPNPMRDSNLSTPSEDI